MALQKRAVVGLQTRLQKELESWQHKCAEQKEEIGQLKSMVRSSSSTNLRAATVTKPCKLLSNLKTCHGMMVGCRGVGVVLRRVDNAGILLVVFWVLGDKLCHEKISFLLHGMSCDD